MFYFSIIMLYINIEKKRKKHNVFQYKFKPLTTWHCEIDMYDHHDLAWISLNQNWDLK